MSGGGKGGETETKLNPEMEAMARQVWQKGKSLSELPPTPYMGLTMAAPSAATKTAWTNTNKAANSLGLGMAGDPADGIQVEEVTRNGMTGYSAFPAYQEELQEAWRQYPERMAALNKAMPGLMQTAKDWRPGEKYGNALPTPPQTPAPGMPGMPGMPQMPGGPQMPSFDFSQIAALYNQGGGR